MIFPLDLATPSSWILSETTTRSRAVRSSLERDGVTVATGLFHRASISVGLTSADHANTDYIGTDHTNTDYIGTAPVWCGTVGEGIYRIAHQIAVTDLLPGCTAASQLAPNGPFPRRRSPLLRLTELQAVAVLRGLILSDRATFSRLAATVGPTAPLAEAPLGSIKRLIDVTRLFQSSERLIATTIDEFGNTLPSKLRAEEVVLLLDRYQRVQREHLAFDSVGLLEVVTEALHHSRLTALLESAVLPPRIVCDRPTFLYPLGAELWEGLRERSEIAILLDEVLCTEFLEKNEGDASRDGRQGVRPSVRHATSLRRLLTSVKREEIVASPVIFPERERVVSAVLDGEREDDGNGPRHLSSFCRDSAQGRGGVRTLQFETRREEVRHVVQQVATLLQSGVSPERIFIVPLESEPYGALLRKELGAAAVPFSLERGVPLRGTPPGSLFAAVFSWLERPSLQNAVQLWGSEFGRTQETEVEAVRAQYPEAFLPLALDPALKAAEPFRPAALLEVCRAAVISERLLVECPGESEFALLVSALSRYLVRSVEKKTVSSAAALSAIRSLFTYIALAKRALATEISSPLTAVRAAERLYAALRPRFSRAEREEVLQRSGASPEVVRDLIRGTRQVRRSVRGLSALLALEEGLFGEEVSSTRDEVLRTASAVVVQSVLLSSFPVTADADPTTVAGVRVLDLSQTRAIDNAHVFLLGALSSAFPTPQQVLGNDVHTLAFTLAQRAGSTEGVFESYWLLAHHLRNANTVTLSSPRETGGRAAGEAVVVQELRRWFPQSPYWSPNECQGSGVELSRSSAPPPSEEESGFLRRSRLVNERRKKHLTPYDGVVGAEHSRALFLPEVERRGGYSYSVSSLETYLECPHRFFFQHALQLKNRQIRPFDQINQLLGSIIHEALSLFYSDPTLTAADFSPERFPATRERMFQIASKLFSASEVNWFADLRLEEAIKRAVGGLVPNSERSEKKGLLLAALDVQRVLLGSLPVAVEFHFGGKDTPVLLPSLAEDGEWIALRGMIDRIDRVLDGGEERFVVWDYKTGAPDSSKEVQSGRSLQLPVYALAVQRLLSPFQPPLSGGQISLKNGLGSDDELRAACGASVKSPLVEHLALSVKGCSAAEVVAARLEETIRTVQEIDSVVREGRFSQHRETKWCARCEFRSICCRDTALLEEKLRAAGNECEVSSYPDERQVEPGVLPAAEEEPRNEKPGATALSAEQEQACAFDHDVALFAGAGSGKTLVLRTRVLRLLLRGESLSSLLAITFTEKAAEEIRERIERAIGEALRENSFEGRELTPLERARLSEARALLPNAMFGTIHSFCRSIIGMESELSGVGPSRLLPMSDQVVLLDAVVSELFDRAVQKPAEVVQALEFLIESGITPFLLVPPLKRLARREEVIEGVVHFSTRYPTDRHREEFLEGIRRELSQEVVSQYRGRIASLLEGMTTWFAENHGKLKEGAPADFQWVIEQGSELCRRFDGGDWVDDARQFLQFLVERSGSSPRKSPKNPVNFWLELRDTIKKLPLDVLQSRVERDLAGLRLGEALCQVARYVSQRYSVEKRLLGAVDYDDLITIAHRMVTTSEPLRLRLRRQFRHLMVDEFQDTDTQQWEIVRAIAEGEFAADEFRTLFIVGDPQQAIYGFRGGDVRVFHRSVSEIRGRGGVTRTLQNNYRSHAEVLRFVNTTFSALFGFDYHDNGAPRIDTAVQFQEMHSGRRWEESHPRVEHVAVNDRSEEAHQVAAFISRVLTDVRSSGGGASYSALRERAKSGEGPLVAVLTRSVGDLLSTAHALTLAGVPYSITHSSGFYSLQEIITLENLLKVLADPTDDIALVGVLRSPLIGLSDQELAALFVALNRQWGAVWQEEPLLEDWVFRDVSATLARWRALKKLCSAGELLLSVVHEVRLEEVLCRVADPLERFVREGEYRNVLRFIDELLAAERAGECSGSVLSALQWLGARRLSGASAPDANQRTSDVVLTTVHGSKGLEYPMVILPFLQWGARQSDDFLVGERDGATVIGLRVEDDDHKRTSTLLSRWLNEHRRLRDCAEERRVFYVGCTRAQEYLVLFRPAPKKNQSEDSAKPSLWLELLIPQAGEEAGAE